MDKQVADMFGAEWLRAWGERDLDAIMEHYAEDAEQQSLLVCVVLNDASGTVSGKDNIREYFRKVMAAYPSQPGESGPKLLGVFRGVNSLIVHFETRGMYATEFMELDARGKVRRGRAHFLG
jgi:SnoaL-like protein